MQTVYLLHFDRKYKHARHYIGWTRFLDRRLDHHRNGTGARLMRAVVGAGIDFVLARKWEDKDGNFERKLHNYKNARDLCPICNPDAYKHMKG